MRRLILLILAFFLGLVPVAVKAGSQSGTVIMEFDLTSHQAGKEVKLWVPYPVSDRNQLINEIRITGDFDESAVYTDREYGMPMLYARWGETAKNRKLIFSFMVEREERIAGELPSGQALWDQTDYAHYLQPTRLGPTNGSIRKLASEITEGRTGVRDKTRAIYDWICDNMFRNPDIRGCGSGDVCSLLNSRGGKCADISSVFVALTRAAGIPSREVFGIRLGKSGTTDITKWQHCWAEYYLPGYGWVVVDPADVLKMILKESLDTGNSKTAEYREYFWGGVDPFRVRLGEGRDLTLNPPQTGGPVNYLMYPYAQIGGETLDWLEPDSFRYRITHTDF
jgi:transglutaminase-like putative cysteine protease